MDSEKNNEKKRWGTVIVGAGQAGLTSGYYLLKANEDFIIIDSVKRVGDSWRKRWNSLCLFTPAQYDSLPGFPFPKARGTFPTKDEMADYLEEYAQRYNLPVRLGETINRLSSTTSGYVLSTAGGIIECDRVIVATGTNQLPRIPDFAKDVNKSVYQIHSSQYINPDSLPPGDVLVVGAGTSGVEIAIELSKNRHTMLSGKPTFHIPDQVFRYAGRLYWWFAGNILSINTPIGRKARKSIVRGGGPLVNVSIKDIANAGVERLPRVAGIENGHPKLTDGRVVPVSSIIWATGFRPDYSWIDTKISYENGWPATHRGIPSGAEGLYFVGMLFQYALTSGLVGGVGRDAAHIVNHIRKNIRN